MSRQHCLLQRFQILNIIPGFIIIFFQIVSVRSSGPVTYTQPHCCSFNQPTCVRIADPYNACANFPNECKALEYINEHSNHTSALSIAFLQYRCISSTKFVRCLPTCEEYLRKKSICLEHADCGPLCVCNQKYCLKPEDMCAALDLICSPKPAENNAFADTLYRFVDDCNACKCLPTVNFRTRFKPGTTNRYAPNCDVSNLCCDEKVGCARDGNSCKWFDSAVQMALYNCNEKTRFQKTLGSDCKVLTGNNKYNMHTCTRTCPFNSEMICHKKQCPKDGCSEFYDPCNLDGLDCKSEFDGCLSANCKPTCPAPSPPKCVNTNSISQTSCAFGNCDIGLPSSPTVSSGCHNSIEPSTTCSKCGNDLKSCVCQSAVDVCSLGSCVS